MTVIDRNVIVKNAENFSEHKATFLPEHNFAWKFLNVTEKSSKNRNDFTQMTSMTIFSQSQISLSTDLVEIEADFDIKLMDLYGYWLELLTNYEVDLE